MVLYKKKRFKGKFKGKGGNGTKRPPPPPLPVLVFWRMDGQPAGRLPEEVRRIDGRAGGPGAWASTMVDGTADENRRAGGRELKLPHANTGSVLGRPLECLVEKNHTPRLGPVSAATRHHVAKVQS